MRTALLLASSIAVLVGCPCLLPARLLGQFDADATIEQVVDHFIEKRLSEESVQPAAQVSDALLLRRMTLDLVGRVPSSWETREFVASTSPTKRADAVDRLLNSPGFARHQVDELDAILMYPDSGNLREYLKKSVAEDRRWNDIFKDLMLAEQGEDPNAPASAFIKARLKDLDKMTNEVSVRFFGVNISCAQCHDHPLVSDWKQDHYYGMKSFFARTFENGGFIAERSYGLVDFTTTNGEQRRAKLMFLNGQEIGEPEQAEPTDQTKQDEKKLLEKLRNDKKPPPAPSHSRRSMIVETGLSPVGKRWLARSITNRVWYRLMGFGLVMPIDQMHSENPPSHPELLQWLADDLIAHEFDLRRLMRGLMMSRAYSRDSAWEGAQAKPDDHLFAVGRIRLMTPYQLAASLRVATLDPVALEGLSSLTEKEKRVEDAAQAGRNLSSRFEMPREDLQLSVSEALFFSNNKQVVQELLGSGLVQRVSETSDSQAAIELAFQSVLGRPPDPDEADALQEYLQTRSDRRREACQQIVWSLLASSEFRFNY